MRLGGQNSAPEGEKGRVRMGLKGSFREFSVSDIIQLIYYQKKSGCLTVRTGGRQWVLGFEKGMLVFAAADERGMPRLGEILVRQGYIDRDDLAAALRDQEKKPRHLGQVLEDMDKVSHGDIARALGFQIQETALHLFFRDDGEYTFERVPVHYDDAYVTPVNTEFLLMEGARRVDEWPAIRKVVQGGNAVFTVADGVSDDRKESLGPSELAVLEAVDGERTVTTLVRSSGLGLFETCRILTDLAGQGLIERTLPGSTPLKDPISGDALPAESQAAAAPAGRAAPSARAAASGWPADGSRRLLWMGMGAALVALSLAIWLGMGGPTAP
jgi:hypothetical protein